MTRIYADENSGFLPSAFIRDIRGKNSSGHGGVNSSPFLEFHPAPVNNSGDSRRNP
jgi:hypothetical protein